MKYPRSRNFFPALPRGIGLVFLLKIQISLIKIGGRNDINKKGFAVDILQILSYELEIMIKMIILILLMT